MSLQCVPTLQRRSEVAGSRGVEHERDRVVVGQRRAGSPSTSRTDAASSSSCPCFQATSLEVRPSSARVELAPERARLAPRARG